MQDILLWYNTTFERWIATTRTEDIDRWVHLGRWFESQGLSPDESIGSLFSRYEEIFSTRIETRYRSCFGCWHAYVYNKPGLWAFGPTSDDARGKLIMAHKEVCGVGAVTIDLTGPVEPTYTILTGGDYKLAEKQWMEAAKRSLLRL